MNYLAPAARSAAAWTWQFKKALNPS